MRRPGIITRLREKSQVQVYYEEVKEIENKENPCSPQGPDDCFESYLIANLTNSPGCLPPWIDLQGLPYCDKSEDIIAADDVLQQVIAGLDQICRSPCHYLIVTSGSKNFERLDAPELHAYLYFPFGVQLRLKMYRILHLNS